MRFFLLFVAAVTFGSAVAGEYVSWDDRVFVVNNGLLDLPLRDFLTIAFTRFFHGDYLPVTLASYWLEVAAFGRDPLAQHAVNLVLHLLNVLLLTAYMRKLAFNVHLTLFVAAVFALHPLQAEPVMWISERKGLLCAFFSLAAMNISAGDRKDRWAFYWIFYLLGVLSKLSLIFLPIFLFVMEFKRGNRARLAFKHGLPLLAAAAVGTVRTAAYGGSHPGLWGELLRGGRLLELPLRLIEAWGFFLQKFLVPAGLSIIYPSYSWTAESWLRLVLCAAFAGLNFFLYKKGRRREVLFFAGAFVIFLLPSLPLVPRINFVNDRFVYLALIGPAGCVFLALGLLLKERSLKWLWVAAALTLALPAHTRAKVWRSNEALWIDTVAKNPGEGLAHLNLGEELMRQKKYPEAIAQYESVLRLAPDGAAAPLAHANLSQLYLNPELPASLSLDRAEEHLLAALAGPVNPNDRILMRYNLTEIFYLRNKKEEALALLNELEQELAAAADVKNHQLRQFVRQRRQAYLR